MKERNEDTPLQCLEVWKLCSRGLRYDAPLRDLRYQEEGSCIRAVVNIYGRDFEIYIKPIERTEEDS